MGSIERTLIETGTFQAILQRHVVGDCGERLFFDLRADVGTHILYRWSGYSLSSGLSGLAEEIKKFAVLVEREEKARDDCDAYRQGRKSAALFIGLDSKVGKVGEP